MKERVIAQSGKWRVNPDLSKGVEGVKIQFADGTEKAVTNVLEQKIIQGGVDIGWTLAIPIREVLSSEQVDALVSVPNISHLVITRDDGSHHTLTGYNKVTSVLVRYDPGVTEVQVSKQVIAVPSEEGGE